MSVSLPDLHSKIVQTLIETDFVVVRQLTAESLFQEALLLNDRLEFETDAPRVVPFEPSGYLSSA